jgi:hypothetical protein
MKPGAWEEPLPRSNKVRSLKFFHGLLQVSSRTNGAAAFLQAFCGARRGRKASAHKQLKVKLRPALLALFDYRRSNTIDCAMCFYARIIK